VTDGLFKKKRRCFSAHGCVENWSRGSGPAIVLVLEFFPSPGFEDEDRALLWRITEDE